jgi:hypothetical protein
MRNGIGLFQINSVAKINPGIGLCKLLISGQNLGATRLSRCPDEEGTETSAQTVICLQPTV